MKKNAAEAVADFIKFPDMFQFDLLEAEAVTQLRTDAEYGPLFKLLNILLKSTSIKVACMILCIGLSQSHWLML